MDVYSGGLNFFDVSRVSLGAERGRPEADLSLVPRLPSTVTALVCPTSPCMLTPPDHSLCLARVR